MRTALLLILPGLASCAAPMAEPPSLAPRAAESIDPRVPITGSQSSGTADARLVETLNALVALAMEGDRAFQPRADQARQLATAAGPRESESWVVAQEALSGAIAARAPVTKAAGDIDSLGARRIVEAGGMGPADLEAIRDAAARVAQIDERESTTISEIQALLSR